MSGRFCATVGELKFKAPVVFNSTYYQSYGGEPEHAYLLYLNNELVYEGEAGVMMYDPDSVKSYPMYLINSGYSGPIDSIRFFGSSDGSAIDNFTYTTLPVPEPETYVLMLAGIGMLGLAKRRKIIG